MLSLAACQSPQDAAQSEGDTLDETWRTHITQVSQSPQLLSDRRIFTRTLNPISQTFSGKRITPDIMRTFDHNGLASTQSFSHDLEWDHIVRCNTPNGLCYNYTLTTRGRDANGIPISQPTGHVTYAIMPHDNSNAVHVDVDQRAPWPHTLILAGDQTGIEVYDRRLTSLVWWQTPEQWRAARQHALQYAHAYDRKGPVAFAAAQERDATLDSIGDGLGTAVQVAATTAAVVTASQAITQGHMTQNQGQQFVEGVYRGDTQAISSSLANTGPSSTGSGDFQFDGIRDFTVSNSDLEICVSDYECEDGDRVSVTIDGRSIFSNHELFNVPSCRHVDLNSVAGGQAVSGERFNIRLTANNGTGYKGNCSHRNVNTGRISVSGGGGSDTWQVRGGSGTSSSVTFQP